MYWRLHQAIFSNRINEAKTILETLGDNVQIVQGTPSQLASPLERESGPSMAITTLQDANRLLFSNNKDNPTLYYNRTSYNVSFWLSHLEKNVKALNDKCLFLPYQLLLNAPLDIISCVANQNKEVFIKPDAGNKSFVGFTIKCDKDFNENLKKQLMFSQVDPETLCFISTAKKIDPIEWRVWISERKIIASSPYGWNEDYSYMDLPTNVLELAETMANNPWQPDYAYVADFCTLNDEQEVCLIEINAISTSGTYQANLESLLNGLRKTVIKDWNCEID